MINTKPVLGDMRLNVTDNLGKYEVFNGKTWLIMENYDTIESLRAEIETLKKDNKELHAIAQRMAMAESDARKSLQWFKDAKEMNNNFLDYCFGITLIFFGVIMFIIGIGLDIGVIK